jgi:TPP-dependent pyruvate/acetoin dehydrogenase alpha subunit
VLFTDPSGEYESSSRDLSAQICELERVLGEVEAKMRDSLHSRDMKKQMLEKDPVLKQERSLFTNFMADPDRLQNVLGQLATQVTMLATAAVSTEKS